MKFLGIIAALGLVIYNTASAATCDITATASVKIKSIVTTASSAVIGYTEFRTNGGRNLSWGIETLGPKRNVAKRAKNTLLFETITGLIPNSTYKFQFSGIWKGKPEFNKTTGTFKTDGTTCGELVATTGKVSGTVLNQVGDRLPEVAVYIEAAGVKVAFDTTDEKGQYSFELKPGSNYKLYASYAPYTSPGAATVPTVEIGKTYALPNQVLTGAFQLSGVVRLSVGGPVIDDAKVTITHKTDATKSKTVMTDDLGFFTLGLLAGEYSVMAISGSKALPSALNVPITTQSVKLADLILSGTTSIKIMPKQVKFIGSSKPSYKVNGARQVNKSSNPAQVIQFAK